MEILLFGITRDIVGKQKLTITNNENINSVGSLKAWLGNKYPSISGLSSLAVAVDSEYAGDDMPLNDDSEIALIPPVSGG